MTAVSSSHYAQKVKTAAAALNQTQVGNITAMKITGYGDQQISYGVYAVVQHRTTRDTLHLYCKPAPASLSLPLSPP